MENLAVVRSTPVADRAIHVSVCTCTADPFHLAQHVTLQLDRGWLESSGIAACGDFAEFTPSIRLGKILLRNLVGGVGFVGYAGIPAPPASKGGVENTNVKSWSFR